MVSFFKGANGSQVVPVAAAGSSIFQSHLGPPCTSAARLRICGTTTLSASFVFSEGGLVPCDI